MSRRQHSVPQAAPDRLALGKEGGRQTEGSHRGALLLGQATYGSASAASCPHVRQAQMDPWDFTAGSVSLSKESLKKC